MVTGVKHVTLRPTGTPSSDIGAFDADIQIDGVLAKNIRLVSTNPTAYLCNVPKSLTAGVKDTTVDEGAGASNPFPFTVTGGLAAVDDQYDVAKNALLQNLPVRSNDLGANLTITANLSGQTGGTWAVASDSLTLEFTPTQALAGPGAASCTYEITDGVDTSSASVLVNLINDAPVVDPIADQAVDEGQLLSLQASATDDNGDPLIFSLSNAPVGMTVTSGGLINWTPDYSQSGVYFVTVVATDDSLAQGSTIVQVTVNDVGDPILAFPDPYTFPVNAGLQILGVLDNDDGVGLLVQQTNPPFVGGTFVAGGGGSSVNFTPAVGFAGIASCTYTAIDVLGFTSTTSITITIENNDPIVDPITPKNVEETQNLAFTVTATDPDGSQVTLSMSAVPPAPTATFVDNGNGTGDFSWTPALGDAANYQFTFTAIDPNGGQGQTVASVTVTSGAPAATPNNYSFFKNSLLQQLQVLLDDTGDGLSITNITGDFGGTFVNQGTHIDFTPTPTLSGDSSAGCTYEITDSSLRTDTAVVSIDLENRAPVFSPVSPKFVAVGQLLSFTVTATDEDGDPLVLACTNTPTWATFVDNTDGTGVLSGIPGPSDSGPVTLNFTATDDDLLPAVPLDVAVTVQGALIVPSVSTTIQKNVPTPIDVLSGVTNGAPPYRVSATGGDVGGVSAIAANEQSVLFTPAADLAGTDVASFDFLVSDILDSSGTNTATLSIVNDAPVIEEIEDQSTALGNIFTLQVMASDVNQDPLTYSLSNEPLGMIVDANGLITWVADGDVGDVLTITVTVDDGSAQDSTEFDLTITALWSDVLRPQEIWTDVPS